MSRQVASPFMPLWRWLVALLACACAYGGAAGTENERVETRHSVAIGGEEIEYTATAGKMIVTPREGAEERGAFFYIAYTVDAEEGGRPVAFCFNGGPGSSSVWLHLGALGPRRVDLDEEGRPAAPPYELVENNLSLLDVADLVFIDPVSTGYSRPVEGTPAGAFHGIQEDARSVGEFIRLYVTRNRRWSSPKFLVGVSYGALRAAAVAEHLQEQHGMYLNGVAFVSPALNYQTLSFDPGNQLPFALFLPSYAAAAHYHGKLDPETGDLEEALQAAEAFASGDLLGSLFAGDALPAGRREQTAEEIARLTGLSEAYVGRSNLRVRPWRFMKELLREEGKTVGRFDARYTGTDRDDAGEAPEYDPSYTKIHGAFSTLLNDYVRADLGYETDTPYEILAGEVARTWDFSPYENRYADVSERLRRAMTRNPHLRALFLCGYYDLATPYFGVHYTVRNLRLPEAARGNARVVHYPAGHMFYVHKASLAKMKADMAEFIAGAGEAVREPRTPEAGGR